MGELLFPKIKNLNKSNQNENTPKITGTLIDFELYEVLDIIEFLKSDAKLLERVKEAEDLINKNN